MVIAVIDHVKYCYGSSDGDAIRRLIVQAFARNESVTISFEGVSEVTSSFVNSALIALLDDHSFEFIRNHLSIAHTRHQIRDMISNRFRFEISKLAAA